LSFSSPSPATAPAPSHHRGRSRSSAVAAQSTTAAQDSRSSGVVLSTCTETKMTGAHAVTSAARIRPNLDAPNSAAHLAAITTTAPPASAGMTRTAVGLTPSTLVTILVSSGASGGWST
jgi:hypothetical protein